MGEEDDVRASSLGYLRLFVPCPRVCIIRGASDCHVQPNISTRATLNLALCAYETAVSLNCMGLYDRNIAFSVHNPYGERHHEELLQRRLLTWTVSFYRSGRTRQICALGCFEHSVSVQGDRGMLMVNNEGG